MKLIECKFKIDDKQYHFVFEGNYDIYHKNKEEDTIDFNNVVIYEIVDNKKQVFSIEGYTWEGTKLDEEDAIYDVVSRYSRNEKDFNVLYIDKNIEMFVEQYKENQITVSERKIPQKILYGTFFDVCELILITDKHTYYDRNSDEILMLDTTTGTVISDNYFACIGYADSLEAIKRGEEKLLYMYEV